MNKMDTIISFDTNTLLNLYLIPIDDLEYIGHYFKTIQNDIWLTNHVKQEFERDREKKITSIINVLKSLNKIEFGSENIFSPNINGYKDFPVEYIDLFKQKMNNLLLPFNQYIKSYKDQIEIASRQIGSLHNKEQDKYYELIKKYLYKNIGNEYTSAEMEKIESEGARRYSKKIPPGYMDAEKEENQFGDYIIWRQLLDKALTARKNVFFVSNDNKEDWKENGKCRSELINEFFKITGFNFKILTLNELIKESTGIENTWLYINDIKFHRHEDIIQFNIWNKKYPYYEGAIKILNERKEEDIHYDDGLYLSAIYLIRLRYLLEKFNSNIICGGIYSFFYAKRINVYLLQDGIYKVVCLPTICVRDQLVSVIVEVQGEGEENLYVEDVIVIKEEVSCDNQRKHLLEENLPKLFKHVIYILNKMKYIELDDFPESIDTFFYNQYKKFLDLKSKGI